MAGQLKDGVTFLGYRIRKEKLSVGLDNQKRTSENILRLYEQGAGIARIEEYLTRWCVWVHAGFNACNIKIELPSWIVRLKRQLEELKSSSIGSSTIGEKYDFYKPSVTPSVVEMRELGRCLTRDRT